MGSRAERLDYLEDLHWVSYPHAKKILGKMERMLAKTSRKRREGARSKRKHHLIIEAESNNGKSSIMEEFEARHPIHENPTGDGIVIPFLLIELPYKADDQMLLNEILKKLKATHQGRVQGGDKHLQVLWLLEQIKVRMLGVDELGNILQGSESQQTAVMNALKYFGNSLHIPIVAASVPAIEKTLERDDQWSNRFHTEFLERWSLNQEFLDLLASFELDLPFPEASNLGTDPDIVLKLFTMSGGLIGEVAGILEDITIQAIENGKPRITVEMLDKLEWDAPNKRRQRR
jgi:hypothetical protein